MNWTVTKVYDPATQAKALESAGFKAYMFAQEQSIAGGTYENWVTRASVMTALESGDLSFLSKAAVGDGGVGITINGGTAGDANAGGATAFSNGGGVDNIVKAFVVVFNGDSTYALVSEVLENPINSMGASDGITAEFSTATKQYSNWTQVGAIPEPTSGLLLLLGVAGLALKRRRV